MTIVNHAAANGWLFDITHRAGLARPADVGVDESLPLSEVWSALAEANKVDEAEIAHHIASYFKLEVADLDTAEAKALKLVPADLARKYRILPVAEDNRHIVIATLDPTDFNAEQDLGFASGRTVVFKISWPALLNESIDIKYAPERLVEGLLARWDSPDKGDVAVMEDDEDEDEAAFLEDSESEPVIKLVNLILRDAVERRASDVHIEPGRSGGLVRFRIDGVMLEYMQMPMPALNRVVSRIKILAKLDIADRIRPQDGRARIKVKHEAYDLRVSTVPTREAEKAVIRILPNQMVSSVAELGLPDYELERFQTLLGHRSGIVIVTGPTGSGKTTTLYAAVNELAGGELNIMTVEDPIEYEIPGITQIQVETKRGVTFASSLRAALRQDPDVIFVGEIRDQETAGIALQASMTGHLVLATLHTNDAIGVVARLTDLGLDAADIVGSLRGVIAQRLIRRICKHCLEKIEGSLTEEEEKLAKRYGVRPIVRAPGCEKCSHTGYYGRMPINEAMVVDRVFEALVTGEASQGELRDAAEEGGMRPLLEVALNCIEAGLSTLQEVDRTLGETGGQKAPSNRNTVEISKIELEPETENNQLIGLIVDDDPVHRRIARRLLEDAGFEVDEAVDGLDALTVLGKGKEYDIMILDLDMPQMGGLEVLATVRGTGPQMTLPIIVSTGADSPSAETSVFDSGADDYICKPLDPARFMARVKAVLRRTSGKKIPEKSPAG